MPSRVGASRSSIAASPTTLASTGSRKPYLFNADNVARYAPVPWHSPGSVIGVSYEALDRLARQRTPAWTRQPVLSRYLDRDPPPGSLLPGEPALTATPPDELGVTAPGAAAVAGLDVLLVHPWCLGQWPAALPADTVVIGLFVDEFHRAWPWSDRRWRFVGRRMAELAAQRWHGDAASIGAALKGARSVRSVDEPHLAPWLARWAACEAAPALFPPVDRRCNRCSASFPSLTCSATKRLARAGALPATWRWPPGAGSRA